MTEAAIRAKREELERQGKRPSFMRIAYDKDGEPRAAEIRAGSESLWSWPAGYRCRVNEETASKKMRKHYSLLRADKAFSWDHRVLDQWAY